MNKNYIKQLIKLVEESNIESLEVSSWGRKVKITQRLNISGNGYSHQETIVRSVAPAPTASAEPAAPQDESAASAVPRSKLVPITSPMVGTFYASSAPEADSYVSLNEKVRVGQVVCIVEAMKLMNEIESEIAGRVAEILVENGKPVEFGQELFLIDPE